MSLGFNNDDDYPFLNAEAAETPSETIARLEKELAEAKEAALGNWEALKLLKSICKAYGFDPFAQEPTLNKSPYIMTKEELRAANVNTTKRVAATKHADSADKIARPTWEATEKLYNVKEVMAAEEKMKKALAEKRANMQAAVELAKDTLDASREDDYRGLSGLGRSED